MKFVYKDNFDGDARHIVNEQDKEITLCDELIDERDGFRTDPDPRAIDTVDCSWCIERHRVLVMERARRDVARELGVDESEVF